MKRYRAVGVEGGRLSAELISGGLLRVDIDAESYVDLDHDDVVALAKFMQKAV